VRPSASASAGLAAVVLLLAGGGDTQAAPCNSAGPVVLAEPAFTRGTTNVIRWEPVPASCWENDDSAGKKSTERRFVVTVEHPASGATSSVTVRGDGEVDATIETGDFPVAASAIDGARFSYSVVRKQSLCVSGSPPLGICTARETWTTRPSNAVVSTQDARPPTGTIAAPEFARSLDVTVRAHGTDVGAGIAHLVFAPDAGVSCGVGACTAPVVDGRARVRLRAGEDGPRIVEARIVDGAGAPGAASTGRLLPPPGNASATLRTVVTVDRTAPTVFMRTSMTAPLRTGVSILFDASSSRDLLSGIDATSAVWTFDGVEKRGLAVTHTFTRAGRSRILFRVSDMVGNVAPVDIEDVRVEDAPAQGPPGTVTVPPTAPPRGDTSPPGLSRLAIERRGGKTFLRLRLSERATVRLTVRRLGPRAASLAPLLRNLAAGDRRIRVLGAGRPGRYEVVVAAADRAGNVTKPRRVRWVVRQ
jgi:hypothetical protein